MFLKKTCFAHKKCYFVWVCVCKKMTLKTIEFHKFHFSNSKCKCLNTPILDLWISTAYNIHATLSRAMGYPVLNAKEKKQKLKKKSSFFVLLKTLFLVKFQRRGYEKPAVFPLLPLDVAHGGGEGGGPWAGGVGAGGVEGMVGVVLLRVDTQPGHPLRFGLSVLRGLTARRTRGSRHSLTPEQGFHQLSFHHVGNIYV